MSNNMLLKHRTQSFQHNPYYLNYKELKIGEFYEFRVLSLEESDTVVIPCRKVVIMNPRTRQPMSIPIHDPGFESASTLTDAEGKRVSDCPITNIYRIPVFVTKKGDNSGNLEEINRPMYLEFGEGIKNSFFELEDEQGGMFQFLDNESGVPDYEVRLLVIPGPSATISKNYKIEGVYFDAKAKKPFPTFGKTNEEALVKFEDTIADEWDAIQDAMNITEANHEAASKRLRSSEQNSGPALSNRPVLGGTSHDASEESPENETKEQSSSGRYKFRK